MAKYSKFIMAILAMATVVGESEVVPERVRLWVQLGTVAVGAGLVYLIPNVDLPNLAPIHQGGGMAQNPAVHVEESEQDEPAEDDVPPIPDVAEPAE